MSDGTVKTADGYSAALRYDETHTEPDVSVEVAEGTHVTVGIEHRGGRTVVTVKPVEPPDEGESGYRNESRGTSGHWFGAGLSGSWADDLT